MLDLKALKKFAEQRNEDFVRHYLAQPWAKMLECEEPSQSYHILRVLSKCFRADSSVLASFHLCRDKLLRLDLLSKIRTTLMDRTKQRLVQGARSVEVAEEIKKVMEITSELARAEDQPPKSYFSDRDPVLPYGMPNLKCEL